MDKFIKNAYAKINWSLLITGRRDDGYHELDMLMQEIDLHDVLSLEKASKNELFVNGMPSDDADNLVVKAITALSRECGRDLPVRVRLTKVIPSRAGLGGGSADCAQTLHMMNELFELNISMDRMNVIAAALGADVPFFLHGGLCRVRGIGEKVEPVTGAPSFPIVIKHVGDGLSTPEVYRKCDEIGFETPGANTEKTLRSILDRDLPEVNKNSANALEKAAFALDERIPAAIEKLYEQGALYARMSGSGSAVYGVFENETSARRAAEAIPGSIMSFTRA